MRVPAPNLQAEVLYDEMQLMVNRLTDAKQGNLEFYKVNNIPEMAF